jgi:hypothetical protein
MACAAVAKPSAAMKVIAISLIEVFSCAFPAPSILAQIEAR